MFGRERDPGWGWGMYLIIAGTTEGCMMWIVASG